MPLLETMLPKNATTEKPTEWNRLQQAVLVRCTRALGFVLVFVLFWGLHALGKNCPRFKEGEQQSVFWLSHGEKSPAPSQLLLWVLKTRFVAERREGTKSGGERDVAVPAQQHLLLSRKPRDTSEKRVCPWGYLASRDFSISTCKTRDADSNRLCNHSEVCEDLII